MFREMRRSRQQLPESAAVDILKEGKTAVLSVLGDEGYPYTVPINYVYQDGRIYFHCAKTGHKLDAIRRCDKVSLCVIDKDDVDPEKLQTYFRSVIVFGRARVLVSEEEIYSAAELFGLKYCPDKEAVQSEIKKDWNNLSCVEIVIEHVTGKEARELVEEREQSGES